MLTSVIPSTSVLSRAICLIAATALIGCAAKNPLIDGPIVSAPAAKPQAQTTTASTTTPAVVTATPAVAAPTSTSATTGVQTTKESRLFGIFSPYRVDVQQGNFISQEQLSLLKEGMTPEQVHFVLGSPLLTDIFHTNRWDYVFRMQKGTGEVISSQIVVHFKDQRVARIEAGSLPTEQDYLSLIAGAPPAAPAAKAAPATATAATTDAAKAAAPIAPATTTAPATPAVPATPAAPAK